MIVIYMITNLVNGKVYIGSTGDVNHRFRKHKSDLNNGIHHNEHLQNAWNKYGSDSFEFKTLMVCPDSERNHCEQMFIDLYDSQNHVCGYNIRDADAHSIAEETKQKISESRKGIPCSDKTKKKLSESHKGILKGKYTGKYSSRWKNYTRIVKAGFKGDKQQYCIQFNGKSIKWSIDVFKLIDWLFENYPDEDLEISMEVLDNVLLS